MKTLIVIPTYQEASNIAVVLRRVRSVTPDADLLVVDDASPDGTADLAEAVAKEVGGIQVLRRPSKSGLGSAYRDGFRWGLDRGYELLVEMDADLSHDPASLPDLLQAAVDGAELSLGSRYVPGGGIPRWTWFRRALSRWGNRYSSWALGLDVADATSGFRVYRAAALRSISLETVNAEGYGFQIEMVYRVLGSGGNIVEVPILFSDRTRGRSKMSTRIVVEALVLVTWWGIRARLARVRRR